MLCSLCSQRAIPAFFYLPRSYWNFHGICSAVFRTFVPNFSEGQCFVAVQMNFKISHFLTIKGGISNGNLACVHRLQWTHDQYSFRVCWRTKFRACFMLFQKNNDPGWLLVSNLANQRTYVIICDSIHEVIDGLSWQHRSVKTQFR